MKRTSVSKKDTSDEIFLTSDNGVSKKIIKAGSGDSPLSGSYVKVHYTGRLNDGSVFDDSRERKKPFLFQIDKRNVILGWDIGVKSMKVGEVAILKCSPDYAYGNRGIGPIPPNSTLYFEVELIEWSNKNTESSESFYVLIGFLIVGIALYFLFNKIYPIVPKV